MKNTVNILTRLLRLKEAPVADLDGGALHADVERFDTKKRRHVRLLRASVPLFLTCR